MLQTFTSGRRVPLMPNQSEHEPLNEPLSSFISGVSPQARQNLPFSSLHTQYIRTTADVQVRESTPEEHYCIQSPSQLHLVMTNVLSSADIPVAPIFKATKRRQVKNACTTCQKACKKCDDARPCLRCVRYGVSEGCVNSVRKARRTGIKRGPYKKRDGRGKRRLVTKAEEKLLAGMSFFHLDDHSFSTEFQQLQSGMFARASDW